MTNNTWPPPFTLRKSQKAKRINLRVSNEKGLELICPLKVEEHFALQFLQSHKKWIEKHWHIITQAQQPKVLPESIKLYSLNKCWKIRTDFISNAKRVRLLHLPEEIVLYGKTDNFSLCIDELKNWAIIQAERYLLLWSREISQQTQLMFNRLSIRGQKNRWGSCNREKNISLNYKLMFLPYNLVEYVIIHELCHTVHLNHSNKFWSLVQRHCVNYYLFRKELLSAAKYLPNILC